MFVFFLYTFENVLINEEMDVEPCLKGRLTLAKLTRGEVIQAVRGPLKETLRTPVG